MNRRSILRLLGLAPIAAPAAVLAASSARTPVFVAAEFSPRAMFYDPMENTFFVGTPVEVAARQAESQIRVEADAELSRAIDSLTARVGQGEARIVSESTTRTCVRDTTHIGAAHSVLS